MIYSFEPIADENSRILILDSIPGGESLRKGQYYGHERNAFWPLIYALCDEEYEKVYDDRVRLLLRYHIALWDVVENCERQGSLDTNIKDPKINDFRSFFREHPKITHVFFNGRTAYNLFSKRVGFDFRGLDFTYLASTSPAYTISFDQKLKDWQKKINVI